MYDLIRHPPILYSDIICTYVCTLCHLKPRRKKFFQSLVRFDPSNNSLSSVVPLHRSPSPPYLGHANSDDVHLPGPRGGGGGRGLGGHGSHAGHLHLGWDRGLLEQEQVTAARKEQLICRWKGHLGLLSLEFLWQLASEANLGFACQCFVLDIAYSRIIL